jgi:hypothetical protein
MTGFADLRLNRLGYARIISKLRAGIEPALLRLCRWTNEAQTGAGGGSRTRMPKARNFKSRVFTTFTTPASSMPKERVELSWTFESAGF